MKFQLNFERLETRENPSGFEDPTAALPPVDPIAPPPMPAPTTNPQSGTPGLPPADPIPVNPPF